MSNEQALQRWPRLARVLKVLAIATESEVACFLSSAYELGTFQVCGPEAFTHSNRTAKSWLKQAYLWRKHARQ